MSDPAYTRAVQNFEALVMEPTRAAHPTPARLIDAAGLSVSSGYRQTAILEADGFLRRDGKGNYLNGLAGLRLGLTAYGLGHLAPVLQPVLTRLRETTQHTAFLACIADIHVQIGPFTIGRVTRRIKLPPQLRLESPVPLPQGQAISLSFMVPEDPTAPRVQSLVQTIAPTESGVAVLGVLTNPARPAWDGLPSTLAQAVSQLTPGETS